MVKITWFGHACFYIEGSTATIITDPHDGVSLGLEPPKVKADIILVSHSHYDHYDGVDLVRKPTSKIFEAGEYDTEVLGVKIFSSLTYHDKSYGEVRGENYVFWFNIDGIKFLHLGDLGHTLAKFRREYPRLDKLLNLGVDILFVPIGGVYTIDSKEALEVVEEVKPKIVIPMHYKIPGLNLPISDEKEFLRLFGEKYKNVIELNKNYFEVTAETLPKELTLVIFKYK